MRSEITSRVNENDLSRVNLVVFEVINRIVNLSYINFTLILYRHDFISKAF